MTPDDVRRDHREIYVQPKVLPFDGTDAEFLDHLIDDDGSVALDHDAYVRSRTGLFTNPHGRDQMLRTVAENRRRLDAQRRATARRRQQQGAQQLENGRDYGLSD